MKIFFGGSVCNVDMYVYRCVHERILSINTLIGCLCGVTLWKSDDDENDQRPAGRAKQNCNTGKYSTVPTEKCYVAHSFDVTTEPD